MTKDKLLALASTVEKLEGPRRHADFVIAESTAVSPEHWQGCRARRADPYNAKWWTVGDVAELGWEWGQPAYTASVDAALTLVPEGWREGYQRHLVPKPHFRAELTNWYDVARADAATPALALVAAALRAIAQDRGDSHED